MNLPPGASPAATPAGPCAKALDAIRPLTAVASKSLLSILSSSRSSNFKETLPCFHNPRPLVGVPRRSDIFCVRYGTARILGATGDSGAARFGSEPPPGARGASDARKLNDSLSLPTVNEPLRPTGKGRGAGDCPY